MRAATRPHLSVRAATVPSVHGALLRALVALFATVALLVIWPLAVVRAQNAPLAGHRVASNSPTIHVVAAGETLWALAERYYGDGREWPKLASRNDVEGVARKELPPGRKLLIPAAPHGSVKADVKAAPAGAAKHAATKVLPAAVPTTGATSTSVALPRYKSVAAALPRDKSKAPPKPAPIVAHAVAAPSVAVRPRRALADTVRHVEKAVAIAGPVTLAAQTSGKSDAAAPVHASSARASSAPRAVRAAVPTRFVANVTPRRAPSASAALSESIAPAASHDTVDDARMSPPSAGHLGIGASSPSDPEVSRPATRIGLVTPADLAAARGKNEVATVFIRYVPEQAEVDASARAVSARQKPAWRRGEYEAAPFAVSLKRVVQAGHIVRRSGSPTGGGLGGVPRVLLADEVEISAPTGTALAVGDRLISANADRVLTKESRVAVPSGVLVVTRVVAGKPILATVQRQSDVIEQGQPLFVEAAAYPAVQAVAEPSAAPDVETRVLWAGELTSIPSLQSFVLLSAGSAQGVKAGDQFALVKRSGIGAASREERVAVARVVRSGPEGSSAMIVRQSSADIAIGEPAFRVARVP